MNIEFLKDYCAGDPVRHGLGFLYLPMKLNYRLNFHSGLIPGPSKSAHSHGSNFDSECLFGELKNIIYEFDVVKKSDWFAATVTCEEGDIPKIVHHNVEPKIVSEEIQNKGDVISHYYKNIHDFELLSDHAVTRLFFTSEYLEDPIIIKSKHKKLVCPYADKGTPEENWEIIEEIIKGQEDIVL